ncbi:MAG: glycoside hydrolase family 1 protein [Euryarchaeota archaeon]|nr:glycoside hydrolase family 1 protein [Euryarchaeota archaeon]
MALRFPGSFLFGVATSGYQIEGGNEDSDWGRWEMEPGRIARGDRTGPSRGCDFWNRYREDVALMKEMGIHAHRLSLSWNRIEPQPGVFDPAALEHYRAILQAHRDAGLQTFVTLHHFHLPTWFADRGGFLREENLALWERFVAHAAQGLRGLVDAWNTINEPAVWASEGYLIGEFPPGETRVRRYGEALVGVMRAHATAYRTLKRVDPQTPAGLVHNAAVFRVAHRWDPLDHIMKWLAQRYSNTTIHRALATGVLRAPLRGKVAIEGLRGSSDFLGINYYMRAYVCGWDLRHPRFAPRGEQVSQMGWGSYPRGLGEVLEMFRDLSIPLYITENGIATDDDTWRQHYLTDHLREVHRAIQNGVDVRGYFTWSYIDNFEWAKGWAPKFGLVGFDMGTKERRVKESARMYGEYARKREIPE